MASPHGSGQIASRGRVAPVGGRPRTRRRGRSLPYGCGGRMLAQVTSGAILGVDAFLVQVEVDVRRGLPSISVVGLPEGAVREGRERDTAAPENAGVEIPARRNTVNLAPAEARKAGREADVHTAPGLL